MISPELDSIKEANIFVALQAWDKAILSGPQIGIMCRDVRNELLWQCRTDPSTGLPCTSFTRWMRVAAPRAYSTAHGYLADVIALKDIPDENLSQIRGDNVGTVVQLSTAVRADQSVLEAAKTQRNDDFVETIRQTHPDQHLEHKKTLSFHPVESAAQTIERALQMAAEDHGASTRDDALELLAVTSIDQWRLEKEVEGSLTSELIQ